MFTRHLAFAVYLLIFICTNCAHSRQIRIAIVDTGININDPELVFCKGLSKDFTDTGLEDTNGHGTNISFIIHNYLQGKNYCIIMVKVVNGVKGADKLQYMIDGLTYLVDLKPDIVNISLIGFGTYPDEYNAIRTLLDNKTVIVAAAGNNGMNLDEDCNVYPACYSNRIITVGNLAYVGLRNSTSNYGKYVKRWELGTNITAGGYTKSGTSQATALVTAKIARSLK